MLDYKFIPFALALYNKKANGIQLLFGGGTTQSMRVWMFIHFLTLPCLYMSAKYTFREHRRQVKRVEDEAAMREKFNQEFNAWKANGKEIPYYD